MNTKHFFLLCTFLHLTLSVSAESMQLFYYQTLNANDPIAFGGNYIVYQGERIALGKRSFFIDARLPDSVIEQYSYVFNSVNKAVEYLVDGTEEEPMTLHIAPYVYWVDDPDDPEIRIPQVGESLPFALILNCKNLRFHGLSVDPKHVVLAANRGQTMGAKGNFTLFKLIGDGITTENLTFGNYCNIDLEYPLLPELSRKKRGSAIVQAQLIICNSDKVFARNCRFVSRLNMNPFVGGGKRVLFVDCHFESTDDALSETAVYLNCDFDFYGSKPFWHTNHTGTVFLNCDMRSFTKPNQYFTKMGGQVSVVNSRLSSTTASYWGWQDFPADESRGYQSEVTLNGAPYIIGSALHPAITVQMSGKRMLDAYCFTYNNQLHYNIYNLLKGDDDWDPVNMKETVRLVESRDGKSYTDLPVQLLISNSRDTIETGKDSLLLHATLKRFGNYAAKESEAIIWQVDLRHQPFVQIEANDRLECKVLPTNRTDSIQKVIINATSTSGLEAACVVYILPQVLDAPKLLGSPQLRHEEGVLRLAYGLNTHYPDQSLITWYRCDDEMGGNPIEIAVSRLNVPLRDYTLTPGDCSKYIMATLQPKDLRSVVGEPVCVVIANKIQDKSICSPDKHMDVNFKRMSSKYQPLVMPGYWTLDCYAPEDTREYAWEADTSIDPWFYGSGINGAANAVGFVQSTKGARLRYTPVGSHFGDMKISFTAVPAKTAGQGFSSATAQYMDVFIKFDTQSMNGYALRLVRTTKFHDAIDFVFMEYKNGRAYPISEPVTTSCYKPECRVVVEVHGDNLIARAEQLDGIPAPERLGVSHNVSMKMKIVTNDFGGLGFQHTGTAEGGASLIKDMSVEWY